MRNIAVISKNYSLFAAHVTEFYDNLIGERSYRRTSNGVEITNEEEVFSFQCVMDARSLDGHRYDEIQKTAYWHELKDFMRLLELAEQFYLKPESQ